MICAVHDKLDALRYRAEFADDKLIAQKLVVVRDVLLEAFSAVRIVVISIVADDYIRPCDDVFDIN